MSAIRRAGLAALLLSACSGAPASESRPVPPLAPYFDCLRTRGEAVVGAHRAGPAPGLPENALETMRATLAANPRALLEIDVQRSADGVLFLLHDERLERTTTGRGRAADLRWRALSRLRLVDDEERVTDARVPRLAEALALVRDAGAIAQLDVKRGVPFAEVIAAVRDARAEAHVIVITYGDRDAQEVARLAPSLMISAEMFAGDAIDRLAVDPRQLLAFTGVRDPSPTHFAALRGAGIEPIFATLGRAGTRLDDRWLSDGDPSEFRDLARDGVVIVATDRPVEVAAALPPVSCRPPRGTPARAR